MVLESFMNPFKAEAHPKQMVLYGFVYASIAIFLANWLFPQDKYVGLVMVFLATLACVPLMYNTIKNEEAKDLKSESEWWLLKEHGRALSFFMWLFVGVTLAFTLWFLVLPPETSNSMFQVQDEALQSIRGQATGSMEYFGKIFFNNVKVLLFCVLFSFLYGAGAIFILNWNASVLGVAIARSISKGLAEISQLAGWTKVGAYFSTICAGLLQFAPHGVLEILAYFMAGLGGGIISVAVYKHDYRTRKFEHILLDSADLLLISLALLFLAAVVETYVTPALVQESVIGNKSVLETACFEMTSG